MSHHAHSPLLSPARQAGPTASPARQAGPTLRLHAPEADTSPPEPSLDWTWPRFFARYVKPADATGDAQPQATHARHRALSRSGGALEKADAESDARVHDPRGLRRVRPPDLPPPRPTQAPRPSFAGRRNGDRGCG